jgi:histidyl-tRNA synthetase
LRILDSKDEKDIEINEMAPKLLESLNESSKKYFDTLIALLEKVNLAYQIDNSLVRGLDYYGHTVFEFVTQELGAQGTVLAGGRYDGLISLMGGPKTPGVGWAAGVERLTDLANKELLSEKRTLISLIAADETGEPEVLKLAARIRNFETHTFSTHIKLTTEIIYGGNVGKKMKKAAGKNTDFALVIGSTEIENKILAVKNMKTGESFQIPFEMDSLMKVLGSN